MKITFNQEAFDRVNTLPNPDQHKAPILSEVLLLKEQLRQLYKLNVKLNKGDELDQLSINVLDICFPNIWDITELENLIEANWINKNYYGFGYFGYGFVKLFLAWNILDENERIANLNSNNPYEYSIRILERKFCIDRERHPIMYRIGMGDTLSANLQKYNQTIPYITSTNDAYLDALDAYYLQYKMLPPWLDADNQRGFVK